MHSGGTLESRGTLAAKLIRPDKAPWSWRPPPERRHKMDLDLEFLIAQVGSLTHRQQQSEQRDKLFVRNLYVTWLVLALTVVIGLLAYAVR